MDVPDPGAIYHNGAYYVATTGGGSSKFPIHKSTDLEKWTIVGHIFTPDHIPHWVGTPNADFWAPELHIVNGEFRAYFTARE